MSKDYQQFERQLLNHREGRHVPFPDILRIQELRSELFSEFQKTEKVPDWYLFLSSYISDEEYTVGIFEASKRIKPKISRVAVMADFYTPTEFETKVSDLYHNFQELAYSRKLSNIYFAHNLFETSTIKQLEGIKTLVDYFERDIPQRSDVNYFVHIDRFCTTFLSLVHDLPYPLLKLKIIEDFIAHGTTMCWVKNVSQQDYFIYMNHTFPRLKEEAENFKKQRNTPATLQLSDIFNKANNSYEICQYLMEDLELTIDKKPNPDLKRGRIGNLTGLLSAIKETPGMLILDRPTNQQLLNHFNKFLNTDYSTFSTRNEDYPTAHQTAIKYIRSQLKK